MKIATTTPDNAILQELGKRLARLRKQRGFSQTELAEEAGLGVATLRRIEAGEGSQLESWLKLFKALQMVAAFDQLLPEQGGSPMAQAKAQSKHRTKKTTSSDATVASKRWGDQVQ